MTSSHVHALRDVQLEDACDTTTRANKLGTPRQALLHWEGLALETVTLEPLASGAARDCFAAKGRQYVLKFQKGR